MSHAPDLQAGDAALVAGAPRVRGGHDSCGCGRAIALAGRVQLSAQITEQRGAASAWLESAVFSLDRLLRRYWGVYEFSSSPKCLFRVSRARAEQSWWLADGTEIRAGAPIVEIHLWNEHMPAMGKGGPTIAWARQFNRRMKNSLSELARYLEQTPELREVVAICGDMHLGRGQQREQLARIMGRYGFVTVDTCARPGALHRLGKTILITLLVLATNPAAFRSTFLRRQHTRLLLARGTLEQLHGAVDRVQPAR
jgi:hypothetical protein